MHIPQEQRNQILKYGLIKPGMIICHKLSVTELLKLPKHLKIIWLLETTQRLIIIINNYVIFIIIQLEILIQQLIMANQTSQHILNTSATLLGFCLFVITALHISNRLEAHIIDELTSIVVILLTFSSIFSLIAIWTNNPISGKKIWNYSWSFISRALMEILIIIIFISLNFI